MNDRDDTGFSVPTTHCVPVVAIREKHHYEAITLREFKSTIPPHLIAHLPEDERFIVETVSRLENQYAWMVENVVRNNGATLDLDERVSALESKEVHTATRLVMMEGQADKVGKLWDWKQFLSGKWAVVAALALVVIPLVLKFLLDAVVKWLKP